MPSSAALRIQIERELEHRYPSVLTPTPHTIREVVPTEIPELDELLNGGLPIGAISELTGPASSGRTSITMTFLARLTHNGNHCAWIDVNDAFDPESAAANGVCLKKLLWVRCCDAKPADQENKPKQRPGTNKPWTRLDHAIRATDLLLQAGGFAAIVLDLADVSIEHARRIPLATWFRFRQAADRTRCSLLVLGKATYGQSSTAVVLECNSLCPDTASDNVLRGFTITAQRGRERFAPVTSITRKPPASTWSTKAQWNWETRS